MNTQEILKQVETTNAISEQMINLLKRRLNSGEKIDLQYIWDNDIELERSQVKKAEKWLLNQWKTPAGKERLNNPFGYREQDVLETLETMYLRGFYDSARYGQTSWFVPIYIVSGKETSFEYYVNGGKIEIIG